MDGYNNQYNGKTKQTGAFCETWQKALDFLSPNQQDDLASSPQVLPQKTVCASLPQTSYCITHYGFTSLCIFPHCWDQCFMRPNFCQSQQKLLDAPSSLKWFVLVSYQYLPARLTSVPVHLPPVLTSPATSAQAPLQGKQQVFPPSNRLPDPPEKPTPAQSLPISFNNPYWHLSLTK